MDTYDIFQKLPDVLLPWFWENKRSLPWREDRNPYHIWVSEIMLQQTRVEAVKGYYSRFLERFPTVQSLAEADDELLHKMWEGLGYYSRVRNMKKAAQTILQQYNGVFPWEYGQVLSLPGIGAYTAGAVCSIAYDLPTPAVDGNVLRLTARLLNDHTPVDAPVFKKSVEAALKAVYPERAGDFTQALMELGATLCGPNRKPDCGNCPCKEICRGHRNGTAEQLPVRTPKKARRTEKRTVFILTCEGAYAIEKRPEKGLLAGLWQFPNVPGKLTVAQSLAKVEEMGIKPKEILRHVEKKHIFTHIEWDMCGVYVETADRNDTLTWMDRETLRSLAALPTAFRQFLT